MRSGGADPVSAAARRHPEAAALDDGAGTVTWKALDRLVDGVARRLTTLAGARGRRVATVLPPGLRTVELIHAGPRAGVVVAPLSARLTPSELADALSALDPAAVVCGPTTRATVTAMEGPWRIVEVDGGGAATAGAGRPGEALADVDPAEELPRAVAPDEVAYVLWTSGTSGRPRGVCIRSAALAASAEGSRERLGLSATDRWLASLSPAHVGGLALLDRAARLGSSVVVRARFDEAELSSLADEGRVSHASLVPLMLRRLLDHRAGRPAPEGLGCLLIGGAHAPRELVRRAVRAGYPVALTYGMTETTSQATTAPPERVRDDSGSVGRPLPGVEIRIADGGEIRVRGGTLAAGYLGAGGGRLEPLELDGEGWLRTGDLGRIDEAGELYVTGRLSDRIITGGVTVDAREVEEALRGLPGVADAAVVGLPDVEWGERVSALVVPERGAGGALPDEGRLAEDLRARLSGPKRPRLFGFTDHLPRNRNGKVDRSEVRRILRERGDDPERSVHAS